MPLLYSELHCLSNFSFLRGASHPEELVQQAAQLGYQALAITDECSLAGVVRAYTAIKEQALDIHLVIGAEFNIAGQCFVLLAPCRQAYGELSHLITLAQRRCDKGHYRLELNDLEQGLAHCLVLWRPNWPLSDSPEHEKDAHPTQHHTQHRTLGLWLKTLFEQRLWLLYERELNHDDMHKEDYFRQLGASIQLPIVAAGHSIMHDISRQRLQHVMTAIRLGKSVQDCGFALSANQEGALRPLSKIARLYPEEWLAQTQEIHQRCHFSLASLAYEYPAELVPDKHTPISYLRELVSQGIGKRFPDGASSSILETIEKELTLIDEQGYAHFFLTIHDIVMFAQKQQILYQGRGSAANSIVCYCLEITPVDPQKIHVLFERFISKERDEPPDIDVDFEHERREEVIQYIYQKYGRSRAALAATVITYRFKSAVREVGKALGFAEEKLSFFIANVDRRDNAIGWQPQLQKLGLNPDSPLGLQFIQLVEEIIGFPRHLSQHVGGFVISSGPLSELVPCENAAMENRTVIQWDKDDLESLGLLKVDILALGMLTAIRKSFDFIQQFYHRQHNIAEIIRDEDVTVYDMLCRADSIGVFQVESRAQTNMLPRLRPRCYYDLVIQIAIVRPGPIQGDMVHPYLRRRNGDEAVSYPSPEVEQVLSRTLGVPIFQEQVIQLAMVAAGFSGGEADRLRRAMASWKRNGELQQFRHKLTQGMAERGYDMDFAERIFQQILGFGEYGFPEAHSASFAVLAYTSAWLKHHYPAAFCCALLNSQPMGFYTPSQLIQDVRRHGIQVAPVSINDSSWHHQLYRNAQGQIAIRLGYRLIKGLSRKAAERLILQRPDSGFTSMQQVLQCGLHKDDLDALASANAFTQLASHRYQARWEMQGVNETLPLFEHLPSQPSQQQLAAPCEVDDILEDYASLGLTLQKHPMQLLREQGHLRHCVPAAQLGEKRNHGPVSVAGIVTGRQRPATASGVTFMTLEDETGNVNVVVWQDTARAQKQTYLTARVLKVKGTVEKHEQVIHVMAGKLTDISYKMAALQARSRDFH